MKRAIILFIILFVVYGHSAVLAHGAIVTIAIEGVVDYVGDPYNYLSGMVNVGDLITGTLAYDTDASDSNPSGQVGDHKHYGYPFGIYLCAGALVFETDPTSVDFLLEIVNDNAGIDACLFTSWNNLGLASGVPVEGLYWTLRDSTQTALSSDALLTVAPSLENWAFNRLAIHGPSRGESFGITGHVTSAWVVPEPGVVVLLGLGGLLLRRRK